MHEAHTEDVAEGDAPDDAAATDEVGDDVADADTVADERRRARLGPPRTVDDWVQIGVTAFWVVVAVAFIWQQVGGSLLLADNLPTGGDMGAHVWGPDYLRRELLPSGRLSGWTPDWYAGFPAYHFYMVLPSLLVLLYDVAFSYGVAFKLATVTGMLTLPVAAWGMARLFRLRYPAPLLAALATLPFLFDGRFTIYGGNAASTLAGEFAFSLSLSAALVYLGVVGRGLETGRHRALAATLYALVILLHLIPALFATLGTIVLGLLRATSDARRPAARVVLGAFVGLVGLGLWIGVAASPVVGIACAAAGLLLFLAGAWWVEPAWRASLLWVVPVGLAGAAVSGFWALPFVGRHAYFNDMGWERIQLYAENLAPGGPAEAVWFVVMGLAVAGAVLSLVERNRFGAFLVAMAAASAGAFVWWPDTQMWNARFLPFYYLSLHLLAALGLALLVCRVRGVAGRSVLATASAVVILFVTALPLGSVPGATKLVDGEHRFLGIGVRPSFIDDWARWNYSGYEDKAGWEEYRALVDTMADLGASNGCGRAMWEYDLDKLNTYGTPMALMLLPYWTDGCIGSMEGLYFESAATTPFHFLNQAELSDKPSSAQRDLPYRGFDMTSGVDHLQLLGARYYLAYSDRAKGAAADDPDLRRIGTSGPWAIYEVKGSDLVVGLTRQPAVVTGVAQDQKEWLPFAADYYMDRSRWDVMLAADGPETWQRVAPDETPKLRAEPDVKITDLVVDAQRITFEVDQPGTPVLVKASYFPNWEATGADGPYRVAPNLMVVVPTGRTVELQYGRTGLDWLGIGLTLLGIVAIVVLARRRPLTFAPLAAAAGGGPVSVDTPTAPVVPIAAADDAADGPTSSASADDPVGPDDEDADAVVEPADEPPTPASPPTWTPPPPTGITPVVEIGRDTDRARRSGIPGWTTPFEDDDWGDARWGSATPSTDDPS